MKPETDPMRHSYSGDATLRRAGSNNLAVALVFALVGSILLVFNPPNLSWFSVDTGIWVNKNAQSLLVLWAALQNALDSL